MRSILQQVGGSCLHVVADHRCGSAALCLRSLDCRCFSPMAALSCCPCPISLWSRCSPPLLTSLPRLPCHLVKASTAICYTLGGAVYGRALIGSARVPADYKSCLGVSASSFSPIITRLRRSVFICARRAANPPRWLQRRRPSPCFLVFFRPTTHTFPSRRPSRVIEVAGWMRQSPPFSLFVLPARAHELASKRRRGCFAHGRDFCRRSFSGFSQDPNRPALPDMQNLIGECAAAVFRQHRARGFA